jgi:hypothetical protein
LFPDGRHPTEAQWLLLTNDPLTGVKRIAWAAGGLIFAVHGDVEPAFDGEGFHHSEATLRRVAG